VAGRGDSEREQAIFTRPSPKEGVTIGKFLGDLNPRHDTK